MELGACVSLLVSATPLAMTACPRNRPRWHASPKAQADVTVRPFPLLWRVILRQSSRVLFKYAIYLFLVPFVFPSCTEPVTGNRLLLVALAIHVFGRALALVRKCTLAFFPVCFLLVHASVFHGGVPLSFACTLDDVIEFGSRSDLKRSHVCTNVMWRVTTNLRVSG